MTSLEKTNNLLQGRHAPAYLCKSLSDTLYFHSLPGKSNSSHYAACGQENRLSSSSQYHHGIKDNYHQQSWQRAPNHGGCGAGSSSVLPKHQGQFVRQPPSSTQSAGQRSGPAMLQASVRQPSSTLHTKPQMSGGPVTGTACCSVGAAKEPTRDMVRLRR